MISHFKLKAGRTAGAEGEQIAAAPINVFVGPNNSGKSKLLREIEQYCRKGHHSKGTVVLDSLQFLAISEPHVRDAVAKITSPPKSDETPLDGHVFVGNRQGRHHVPLDDLVAAVKNPQNRLHQFCNWFLTHSTLMLDGQTRISLVNNHGAGDLTGPPESSLQVLFVDDEKRAEVRRVVFDAFTTYFAVDPTRLGQFRIRLSSDPPTDVRDERSLSDAAIAFHNAATLIEECSDGVKAFTGIVMEVIAGDPRVMLIDEPEAFLHPSLAFKLGLELARAAGCADKRIFVSTHSPAFVMGCIQAGTPINIIRLTYRNGVATARVLPSGELLPMLRHPLLRSANVLTALFYEFVVVTEADTDRAFYNEVNERLLQSTGDRAIPYCLFLNAQNKQTIHTIIRPLRQLGIPVAGIVDVDILKNGGTEWSQLMASLNVPDIARSSLATLRSDIRAAIDRTGLNMKRDGGISVLKGAEREAADNLFMLLAQYGLFVVPGGELESWLKALGAPGHGPSWLTSIFERMGDDPEQPTYVVPGEGDVWQFVAELRAWLINPNRKGIPG